VRARRLRRPNDRGEDPVRRLQDDLRSRTLDGPTDVAREIFQTAWELFEARRGGQKIRLVGVRLENIAESSGSTRQPRLDEPNHSWREAEVAADAVKARFGKGP
jgi:DNA polymerase-4